MKFKVGDRAKVIKKGTHCQKIGAIVKILSKEGKGYFADCPYAGRWYFKENELTTVQFTKSDLQNGDIVTQRDGRHKKVCGKNLEGIYEDARLSIENYTEDLLDKDGDTDFDIIKVERPPKNTEIVYERKEDILDEAEKEYLSSVIRPFRDKVKGIVKEKTSEGELYIVICTKNDADMNFPNLDNEDDYKNMEVGKRYALEELGL